MKQEFKIGDLVTDYLHEGEHEIIADTNTPHEHVLGNIYPNKGYDFVLRKLRPIKEKNYSFIHSVKMNLKLLKENS